MGSPLTAWAVDLDGVIWRGRATVPGAPQAIARLRAAGVPLAFVTNSAARTPAEVAEKLASHEIPDAEEFVITAAMAAASMVDPSARVLVVGSNGLHTAVRERGCSVVESGPADVVAVGITTAFDYEMLTRAMQAILGGARFIATNDDSTLR